MYGLLLSMACFDVYLILVPHVKLEYRYFSILNSETPPAHFAPTEFKR
jgi:hypothetical protein